MSHLSLGRWARMCDWLASIWKRLRARNTGDQ